MKNLKIFENEQFGEVRTILDGDTPLFCASDVARALGYKNVHDAILKHCKCLAKHELLTTQGVRELNFIKEPDIYRLIIKSRLPQAQEFERWVFEEVLPSIRKHGIYATEEMTEKIIQDPDFLIKTLTALKEEKTKNQKLRKLNKEQKTEIIKLKPKANYYDALVEGGLMTNIRDTAKEFKLKQDKFIELLKANNLIYRDKKGRVRPYAQYTPSLFELKELGKKENDECFIVQTLITVKGREYIKNIIDQLS